MPHGARRTNRLFLGEIRSEGSYVFVVPVGVTEMKHCGDGEEDVCSESLLVSRDELQEKEGIEGERTERELEQF